MADRKTPLRLLLSLAIVGAAVLGTLTYLGQGPLVHPESPSRDWVSPTRYAERPDNPVPRATSTGWFPTSSTRSPRRSS